MAKYLYNALKNNTHLVTGEVEAANLREAREKIRALGFLPTKVYIEDISENETTQNHNLSENKISEKKLNRLSLQEKIMFTSELEVLLSSSIPVLEALQSIEKHAPQWKIRKICSDIQERIMSGMTFAEALKDIYSKVFGPVYIGLCISGEASGELDSTLSRMLVLLRKQDTIKGKIISASIYPCILVFMMTGLVILFSKFVFPAFLGVIGGSGAEIPMFASMFIGFTEFVGEFWWLCLMFMGALSYMLTLLFNNYSFKKKWDNFILDVPFLSDFIRYINLANFMTVLQISYDAGLPIMSGLELANKSIGNYNIKKRVTNSVNYIKEGKTLAQSFEMAGVLPGPILSMVSAGETSGNLGKMLHDAVEVIDKKVDMALDILTRMFEPTIIVIMGIAVLIILIVFYQLYNGMIGSIFY